MTPPAIRQATRQAFGLGIYRLFATFALTVAGFSAFPGHKAVFALAVIVFNLGVSTVVEFTLLQSLVQESSDRKTRHAIVLAQERSLAGDSAFDEYGRFWGEVDRRVAAELDAGERTGFWKTVGLTAWNLTSRVGSDLIGIAIALVISGG